MATQEVIDYMSGLTGFMFDKDVLNRVAKDRQVEDKDPASFDKKTQDLLTADLLLTAYLSPNVWASYSSKHGSYSRSVGAQTMYNKDQIYNYLLGIYKLYDDPKLEQLGEGGTVSFLNI